MGQRQELPFFVGVYKDETPPVAEGGAVDCDNMRFVRDKWQTQGGRQKATSATFTGIVRGSHAWGDLSGARVSALGTQGYLYSYYGGTLTDITPLKAKGTLDDPFNTASGESVVYVTDNEHGLKAGDTVTFSNADPVGGLTIDGAYEVQSVYNIHQYTIDAGSNASSTATGGGYVDYSAPLDEGLLDGAGGSGFGTGVYSAGTYGTTSTTANYEARTWSMSNFGQNLIACPRYGPIFEWQPRADYTIEFVQNGGFDSSDNWTLGSGWTIGSGVATAAAGAESRLEQDGAGILESGVTYEITFTVTVSAGSVKFFVDSDPTGSSATESVMGAPIEKAGTYTRAFQAPPSPTQFGFKKSSTFAGTIDDVSIKVKSDAYRIPSAVPLAGGACVDANKVLIAWDTIQVDGVYNPLCLRHTPPGDTATWIPNTNNLAGENTDFRGSKIVSVLPTQDYNIIFTDDNLHLMQFTGDVGDAYTYAPIGGGAGLISPLACAEHTGTVYWLGKDGQFYLWRGGTAQSIDCPVRDDMFSNMDEAQWDKITCSVHSKYNEVRWCYPDNRDGKEVSRSVVFNPVLDKWYVDTEPHSDRIPAGVYPDAIGFGTDNTIYYTDIGNSESGGVRTTSLTTGKYDLAEGNNIVYLKRYIPDFHEQVGNITLTIFYQYENNRTTHQKSFTITPTTEKVDFRIRCRSFWLKFTTESAGTYYRMGRLIFEMEGTGAKK